MMTDGVLCLLYSFSVAFFSSKVKQRLLGVASTAADQQHLRLEFALHGRSVQQLGTALGKECWSQCPGLQPPASLLLLFQQMRLLTTSSCDELGFPCCCCCCC